MSKFLKRGLIVLGLGLVFWLLYQWLAVPPIVGKITIINGQGQFIHEDFELNILNSGLDGNLTIRKGKAKQTEDYQEFAAYRVEAKPGAIDGMWTIEFPIPEAILRDAKHAKALDGRLFVMQELPAFGTMSDGKSVLKKRFIESIVDWEQKKIVATIKLSADVEAVGEASPVRPFNFPLVTPAYGGHWDDVKDRFIWMGFCIRYYTAVTIKKLNSAHFVAYAPLSYDHMSIDLALDYMESAYKIIENQLGLSFGGIDLPIHVEMMDKQTDKDGEYFSSDFLKCISTIELNEKYFIKKRDLLSANEKRELKVTCGHELLHLVQEYYRENSYHSKHMTHWMDEATAVASEPLFAGNPNYFFGSLPAYANAFYRNPLLYSYPKLKFGARQEFGYGAAYFWMYLMKTHSLKAKLVGKIYTELMAKDLSVSYAMVKNIALDKAWGDFWKIVYTNPEYINGGFHIDGAHTIQALYHYKEKSQSKMEFSTDDLFKKSISSKTNNELSVNTSLQNLSALPFDFIFPTAADYATLSKIPKLSYSVNITADPKIKVYIFTRSKAGKFWDLYKTIENNGQADFLLKEQRGIRIVVVNYDTEFSQLNNRAVKIHFKVNLEDNLSNSNPTNHQAALKELNQWKNYCKQQKGQQSNEYLTAYYTAKEQELGQAIAILSAHSELIYESINTHPKPDDPIQLQQDLSSAIRMMLDKSINAKNNKAKMEKMANQTPKEERRLYQDAAKFFKLRADAIKHLLRYLAAVNAANELASKEGGSKHTEKWTVSGALTGTLEIKSDGKMNINLSGTSMCKPNKLNMQGAGQNTVNINLTNILYKRDNSKIKVEQNGDLYPVNNGREGIWLVLDENRDELEVYYYNSSYPKPHCTKAGLKVRK